MALVMPLAALVASAATPVDAADDPAVTTTAEAAPVCPTPAIVPSVDVPDPGGPGFGLSTAATPSWGTSKIDGKSKAYKVSAIVEAGGIAYMGGDFKKMTRSGSTKYRNRLAAVNGTTGEITSWNPNASGKVHAMELSSNGENVFVGGDFSYIGGKYTSKLAKVNLATGKVDPNFKVSVKGRVRALTLHGDRLYVGGDFWSIGGQPRPKLAAVDPYTGALLSWTPPALGPGRHLGQTGIPTPDYEAGHVYAIEAIGNKVFAGGNFTNFGCQGGLVTIDAATGGLVEPQYDPGRPIFDLEAYGGMLYAVGGGPGGRAYAFSPNKSSPVWRLKVDGDNMGVAVSASTVYVMGHYDYVVSKDSSCYQFCPGGPRRHHMLAVNRADGQLLAWNPDANTSTGPYTAFAGHNALYVGGEFTEINFKKQPGFTIFPGTP
ncbi:MAG TPA: hypothetical protein VJS45_08530 [Acidimicrobiia bacterium]|nr:hypothetical protein [Acidimicrobiia bacterium]